MATPIKQLLSRTLYQPDGVNTIWDFSFAGGYLNPLHVKAYSETAEGLRTELTGTLIGQYQLEIVPPVPYGPILTIYRDTPKDYPIVDFADMSGLSEIALDTNAKQAIMVAAESADSVNLTTNDIFDSVNSAAASADAASDSAAAAALSEQGALSAQSAAQAAANSANVYDNDARAAATDAQTAAGTAQSIATQGFGFTAGSLHDFGYVTDATVLFPTDLGMV